MESPPVSPARSRNDITDKRAALLTAALDLFARNGLQAVPTSAIARRAGVAKGTLFVYFETKEHLLNELYLEVVGQYIEAVTAILDPQTPLEARLRPYWFAVARWHLDHSAAATFMLQCEVSSVLTEETQARKEEMEREMVRTFFPGTDQVLEGPLHRKVVYALVAGPIQVLVQLRDKGAVEVTDELLEQTFARVERALQP